MLVGRTRKSAAFRGPHAGAIAAPGRRRVPRAQGRSRALLTLESLADGEDTVGRCGVRAGRQRWPRRSARAP